MNSFLRRFQSQVLRRAPVQAYVQAVDRQQAVAWRINKPVWQWALKLREMALPRERWLPDGLEAEVAQASLSDADVADWQRWLAEVIYRPAEQRRGRKSQEAPADFLDNPLAQHALQDLMFGAADGQPQTFYLPWKADYRGRIYAETPWLTPQGGDLQRALFEFATGQVLDEAGMRALRRHGANLAKRGVVLRDLDIQGRQVLTLEEREQWVLAHEDDIVRSAQAPLAHRFWRDAAAKPMQFLAFCLAYAQWKENPEAPLHLPVQIDGTCNGLQHIAALTGDAKLAQAVNVLKREDGLPGDIYSELAESARAGVAATPGMPQVAPAAAPGSEAEEPSEAEDAADETEERLTPGAAQRALAYAQALLVEREDLRALLDRSASKAVVMTVPYGASPRSQAEAMVELLAGPRGGLRATRGEPTPLEKLLQAGPLSAAQAQELQDLVDALRGDPAARRFVGQCTRGRFAGLWARADQGDTDAARQVQALRVLAAYLALALVQQVRAALAERFPGVGAFSRWLSHVARRCQGLPLMWLTPLGLAVCQDRFREKKSTLQAGTGRNRISIGTTQLLEEVWESGQSRQLLPNLVHSLDATHLAMSINMAAAQDITDFGSIHDCLLCRPNEAERLATVLRRAFAKLYASAPAGDRAGVLDEWEQWIALMARLAGAGELHAVKGALEYPDGVGEKLLQQQARPPEDKKDERDTAPRRSQPAADPAVRDAAQRALALVEAVRTLPEPTLQAMALLLIDHTKEVPMRLKPKRGETQDEQYRTGHRTWHPSPNPVDKAPVVARLDLGNEVPSPYFFC